MPGYRSRSSNASPVWLADDDGNPIGTQGGSATAPSFTQPAQGSVTQVKVTLAAGTAATALAAGANIRGARILNYTASAVYVKTGTSGTPPSGAESDYIPAAASGVPGQYEPPFAPVDGLRVVGASAGDLTVISW